MKLHGLLIAAFFMGACSEQAPNTGSSKQNQKQIEENVIYGEDNRIENYQASESLKTLAGSTVALVKATSLVKDNQGKFNLLGSQFGSRYQLCPSEPYREQTTGAFCSGFLVAPDLIATAGHCVTSTSDCTATRFVFDFAVKAPGLEKKSFVTDEIYSCRDVVARTQTAQGADFAVIRLDRPVPGRSPLSLRRSGSVSVGSALFVIGHPAGLPQKIAGGAQVRSLDRDHFNANLDTYGGNSGSAVFNALTNEVEGILVRGENDFIWSGSCSVSNRCESNSCRGEDVTRIDQILSFVPVAPAPTRPVARFESVTETAIPDSPQAGISSSLEVPEPPAGRRVQVEVQVIHSYRSDLKVELMSPSGLRVLLHNRTGGSLDDLRGIYGSDLSSSQSLDLLSREAKSGKWTLIVSDNAPQDIGTLKKWALIFATP